MVIIHVHVCNHVIYIHVFGSLGMVTMQEIGKSGKLIRNSSGNTNGILGGNLNANIYLFGISILRSCVLTPSAHLPYLNIRWTY